MGESILHWGCSPMQWQIEGQRSDVEISGYGEQHKIVVSVARDAGGSKELNHASDRHVGAHARQIRRSCPGGTIVWWGNPRYACT